MRRAGHRGRAGTVERHPYDRRRLDALVAYAEAHRPSAYVNLPVRRLLTDLASPEGVIELRMGGRTALVGAVVDKCENLHDAALLEVLGIDADAAPAPLLAAAAAIGRSVARSAGRPRLSLALPVPLDAALAGLDGWTPAEGSYVMERDLAPWPSPALPPGGAWEDLAVERVGEHYETIRAAFAADPGMLLPDLATFAAASLASDPPVRVLRVAGAEVGFARVSFEEGGRVGYVATIGRSPAWRGGGLGPVVLAEALRVLARRKVERFRLGVTATNTAAVGLYERAGFRIAETWRTWRQPVDARVPVRSGEPDAMEAR
ncbi:MAG: GNAT family N-acetyltransferase [Myxococcota bacterium]